MARPHGVFDLLEPRPSTPWVPMHLLREPVLHRSVVGVGREVVDPTRVRQEMPQGDRGGVVPAAAKEIVVLALEHDVERRVEREPVVLDQPERGRGDERLGDARDPEPSARPQRLAGREVGGAGRDLDVDAEARRQDVKQARRHRRPGGQVALDQVLECRLELHGRGCYGVAECPSRRRKTPTAGRDT
jgi:hypothetical protein